jgi:hypothetical protein
MYTPTATKRPRLPSIMTVSQPIEEYRKALHKRALCGTDPAPHLEPLDVYLVHLLLQFHPDDLAVIDLAAESTTGISSLIGLLHPRVRRLLALADTPTGGRPAYRTILEDFLRDHYPTRPRMELLGSAEPPSEFAEWADAIVLVDAETTDPAALAAQVERWLDALPAAIVLVFGLGAVGDCATLESLLQRFPSGSQHRLTLLRDCSETLARSRLGMVTKRGHAQADMLLSRLTQFFTSNYSYLGLLRSTMERAIQNTSSDHDVLKTHHLFSEWNREINHLKQAARQAQEEIQHAREKLLLLQNTLAYRLGVRLTRLRTKLAPEYTWRFRTYKRTRRAAQIWWREGSWTLFRKIVRRCLRRSA